MDALARVHLGGSYQEENLRLLMELVALVKEIKEIITPSLPEAKQETLKILSTPFVRKRGRPRKHG